MDVYGEVAAKCAIKGDLHVGYTKEEVLRIPLHATGLPQILLEKLQRREIWKVADLLALSENQFLNMDGVGHSHLLACQQVLKLLNVRMKCGPAKQG